MADKQLEQMLALMPDIAAAVNGFSSPAVQADAFWILVMAAGVDLDFVDWEHPALGRSAPVNCSMSPWMGLGDLLGDERLSEAYARLGEAEKRAADPNFAEQALADSLDVEGLRELAGRAAKGEAVVVRKP